MRADLPMLRRTAIKAEPVTGIYFLFLGHELVYIGQSTNVFARVATHYLDPKKEFDCWNFVPVARPLLDREERRLIRRHKPRLNSVHVNPPKGRPVYIPVPKRPYRIELTREQQELIMFGTPTEDEHRAAANWLSDRMAEPANTRSHDDDLCT